MSVLIKGVKKPRNCGECFIGNRTICHDKCPLVEVPAKHGNLIDSSQVMDVEIYDEKQTVFTYKSMTIEELLNTWSSVEIPVVIEAETDE